MAGKRPEKIERPVAQECIGQKVAAKRDEPEQASFPGTEASPAEYRPKKPKKDVMAESVVIKAVVEWTEHVGKRVDVRKHRAEDGVVPNPAVIRADIGDDPAERGMAFEVHGRILEGELVEWQY